MHTIFMKLTKYFRYWSIAVLHPEKGLRQVEPVMGNLAYLRSLNAQGHHIFMKPSSSVESFYMLCDDLRRSDLASDHRLNGIWKPGRLVIETSPANFQVWIRSEGHISHAEKRYWLGRMGSDPGCSPKGRWGRCPGFRNRKETHSRKGRYPLSRLIWIDWVHAATIPPAVAQVRGTIKQPVSYPSPPQVSSISKKSRRDYDRGNESSTDFAYVLALIRRQISDEVIKDLLKQERTNWDNHSGGRRQETYLSTTLRNAHKFIQSQ